MVWIGLEEQIATLIPRSVNVQIAPMGHHWDTLS
jgi:hypothetical protein